MNIPVILAGGSGTRLWPMSRDDKPKQFHNLSGKGTLLEETINRLKPVNPGEIVIVSSKKYEDLSLHEINKTALTGTILSEPEPKNTAAAILYAAKYLNNKYTDSVMIVLPADHYIKNEDNFISVINKGIKLAEKDFLVTIGVKPLYPETGYGYIKIAQNVEQNEFYVERFVEKPDIDTARQYLASGNYFWNSGIFIWKTSLILEKFHEFLPEHYNSFQLFDRLSYTEIASNKPDVWQIKEKIFSSLRSISIDYGIIEKTEGRMLVPADFGWADLGSWKAVDDILEADKTLNRTQSPDSSIFINSNNCTIFSEGMRVAIIGASNLVVVQSDDNILVIDKNHSQDVRQVVEILKQKL